MKNIKKNNLRLSQKSFGTKLALIRLFVGRLSLVAFCTLSCMGSNILFAAEAGARNARTDRAVGQQGAQRPERNFKAVTSKIAYFSCAVLKGQIEKVKELINSGASVAEINNNGDSSTTLIYDALFIENESLRNAIFDILLKEILKDKYKNVREQFLNKRNYRNSQEKRAPMSALEKSFNMGYLDISEKLIEAGAACDSDDCDLNFFYANILVRLRRAASSFSCNR